MVIIKKTILPALLLLCIPLATVGCSAESLEDGDQSIAGAASTATSAAVARDPGILRLLYSRMPTTMNPHLANGFQDFEAARLVYEPLATYDPNGNLVPILASQVPTLANQGVAEDGRSVTWQLRSDVTWSDGQPLTAQDVVFTYQFVSNPQVAAVSADYYAGIEKVEALDAHRVKITFAQPTAAWQLPFTGKNGAILPQHLFKDFNGFNARNAPANQQPVGTGPYRLVAQLDGRWLFAPNERYRETIFFFRIVEFNGDIAPFVAARDVLQTGVADFAHNLQLDADELKLFSAQPQGSIVTTFGSQVERIMLNWADPNKATATGEKASVENPHPVFRDRNVRAAILHAIDRNTITQQLYDSLGQRTSQLLVTPERYHSAKINPTFDLGKAQTLLDQAGWKDTNGNGIRDKAGVELQLTFQAPINPVRQQTQILVQTNLAKIGIQVIPQRVSLENFFSADPTEPQSLNHFYADMQEYATGNDTPDPSIYMGWWRCDEIASQANQWQKPNNARYCNPKYDALWQSAQRELDPQKRATLFQQMDELLAEDIAVIPIVHRALTNGVNQRITGYQFTPWDTSTWDIARWRLLE
jgi:peptide/nickel transport system substrate-binding protein